MFDIINSVYEASISIAYKIFLIVSDYLYKIIVYGYEFIVSILFSMSDYIYELLRALLLLVMFLIIFLICAASSGEPPLSSSYISAQKSSTKEDVRIWIIYILIFIFITLLIVICRMSRSMSIA